MGLFNGKQKKPVIDRKSIFDGNYLFEKSNWTKVFSACLGKMMVVQNACSEIVIKDRKWNIDFSKGIISFGEDDYPIQFIGSESISDNTWLWGWENINGYNQKLIKLANDTRALGEIWRLKPLTSVEFDLNSTYNGHNLSIVTCGISKKNLCYYRGPHSKGAIFVAFTGIPAEVFSPIDIPQFTSLTVKCIKQFYIDHRIFVESLLLWNGTGFEWDNENLIAHFNQDVSLEFESPGEFWRIKSIKTI